MISELGRLRSGLLENGRVVGPVPVVGGENFEGATIRTGGAKRRRDGVAFVLEVPGGSALRLPIRWDQQRGRYHRASKTLLVQNLGHLHSVGMAVPAGTCAGSC